VYLIIFRPRVLFTFFVVIATLRSREMVFSWGKQETGWSFVKRVYACCIRRLAPPLFFNCDRRTPGKGEREREKGFVFHGVASPLREWGVSRKISDPFNPFFSSLNYFLSLAEDLPWSLTDVDVCIRAVSCLVPRCSFILFFSHPPEVIDARGKTS
jgi:hypothetical protein